MVLVCVKLSQGPWYENTSSKLSIISPSGWVQFRVMDVGDSEIAAVMVGVDGAEIKCNRFYTSKTKYDETYCLTKSNSGWANSTTWKLCGESTYSCGVAMTSCKANSYVILRYTITNIHTPLIDTVFVIFCLVDYTISSHSGP